MLFNSGMYVGITVYQERIAPVFEVSLKIFISKGPEISEGSYESFDVNCRRRRFEQLAELGVSTLICGAITRHSRILAEQFKIRVIAFVSGEYSDVLDAYYRGNLELNQGYLMPGCRYGLLHGKNCSKNKGKRFKEEI